MAVIRVPKTPKTAFDRNRRPSDLLLKQIEHLEWAALPASQRKPDQLRTRKVKAEAQAAERIGQLTTIVAAARAAAAANAPGEAASKSATPVTLPPLPPLPSPRSSARTRAKGPRKRGADRRRNRG